MYMKEYLKETILLKIILNNLGLVKKKLVKESYYNFCTVSQKEVVLVKKCSLISGLNDWTNYTSNKNL